jgi:hypothetical protein
MRGTRIVFRDPHASKTGAESFASVIAARAGGARTNF